MKRLRSGLKMPKINCNLSSPKDQRVVVELFDMHVPFNIPLEPVFKYLEDLKKEYWKLDLVLGGDQLDLAAISHWNKDNRRVVEGMRLQDDIDKMNAILDRLDKICLGDKYWFMGNHEDWMNQFVDQYPALEGVLDLEKMLRLKERGYKIIPINKYVKIGKFYYIHGITTSAYHARATVQRVGRTVIYGHCHNVQSFTVCSPIDSRDIHRGISMPCLCTLQPLYGKNRQNNWSNGFGVSFINGDICQHHIIDIFNNRFIGLNGRGYGIGNFRGKFGMRKVVKSG